MWGEGRQSGAAGGGPVPPEGNAHGGKDSTPDITWRREVEKATAGERWTARSHTHYRLLSVEELDFGEQECGRPFSVHGLC